MQGWLKLHRKFKNHWLWKEKRVFSKAEAWIDLLMECNHKEQKVVIGNDVIICNRGQSIRSIKSWAERWGWSRKKVKSYFELLKTDSMIDFKTHIKGTYLTICNYETYQNNDTSKEHQTHIKGTSKEHQTHTNKNVKNVKNEKKLLYTQQQLQKIVSQWNKFAKQKANPDDIAIEHAYTQARARWGDEVIPEAIDNYRQALLLPNSQAWDKPLGAFLKDLEKYLPGIFNLNNFDKSNFEKDKKESAIERAKKLMEANKNAG